MVMKLKIGYTISFLKVLYFGEHISIRDFVLLFPRLTDIYEDLGA